MNIYIVLANITAFIHGLVCVFFASFLIVSLKGKRIPRWSFYIVLPSVIIQWYFIITEGNCPITLCENYFRKLGGQHAYGDGFISHYSNELMGVKIPDSSVMIIIGIISSSVLLAFTMRFIPKRESAT